MLTVRDEILSKLEKTPIDFSDGSITWVDDKSYFLTMNLNKMSFVLERYTKFDESNNDVLVLHAKNGDNEWDILCFIKRNEQNNYNIVIRDIRDDKIINEKKYAIKEKN
jgi:hypothetical protein